MDTIAAIAAGIALAAACGFRVFLPLLAAAVATHAGYLSPSHEFAWIGTTPAVALFGAATLVEVAAYYIPWVDHALDTIASPAAVIAGTVVAAAAFGDVHPAIKWSAALVAGGGAAAVMQTGTVATRALSAGTTAGIGNPLVSTMEWISSLILSVLAIVLPILALILTVVLIAFAARLVIRFMRRRRRAAPA